MGHPTSSGTLGSLALLSGRVVCGEGEGASRELATLARSGGRPGRVMISNVEGLAVRVVVEGADRSRKAPSVVAAGRSRRRAWDDGEFGPLRPRLERLSGIVVVLLGVALGLAGERRSLSHLAADVRRFETLVLLLLAVGLVLRRKTAG